MVKPYRVLVTGSRDWADEKLIRRELTRAWREAGGPIVVVHGGCPTGADAQAVQWVADWPSTGFSGATEERHPADWDHCTDACPQGHRKPKRPGDMVHPGVCDDYCPAAGPRRNRELVRLGADLCLAFIRDGSRGASHTAALAEKAGIPVRRFTA
ncbi:SLOG family protein [Streptomyces prasinus]|uniref:SLOG family protein n=1 Tax=Streptomyces prasinus TaxID=67345 RepID=UPI003333CC2D